MAAFARHGRCVAKLMKTSVVLEVHINSHGFHTSAVRKSNISHLLQHRKLSKLLRKPYVCSVLPLRHNSTVPEASTTSAATDTAAASTTSGYIPECPLPPVPESVEAISQLNALGEPTLVSQGLAAWTPPGFVQSALEYLHVGLDLPWWTSIVIGTVCLRLLLFPVVIKAQKYTAMLHNHMPTIQRLQNRFTEARMQRNSLESAKAMHELRDYQKRNGVDVSKSFMLPAFQLPIFVSVFIGLRKMANLPVESMKTGGALWFTDLTACDPYGLLPVLTSGTLLLTLELGVDGAKASSLTPTMKYVMRAMPLVMCPFVLKFPAAMCVYWFTSNSFSLCQALFLRLPGIKEYFNIPKMIKHDPKMMPEKKGFVQHFKETWDNSKKMSNYEQRERVDAMRFRQAGVGPIEKTYPYDPTKVKGISAKAK